MALGPGLHIISDAKSTSNALSTAKTDPNYAEKTWKDGEHLWLRDSLPARLPKPSRVMLFAYNSSPVKASAAIKLDDHAGNLLHYLDLERKEAPKRPLVFICHSLGGLVVKQALVEATLNPKYKSILEATCLLIFFATPYQGGNYANFGEIVAKIVGARPWKPRNDLIKSLIHGSTEVTRRIEEFRHQHESYLVISFFEGRSYGKLGIVVDKKSATLNLPGTRETQVAMHADHSAICKFAINGSECQMVIKTIVEELKRALDLKSSHSKKESTNVHWCVPRPVNTLFTGRKGVLKRIEAALCPTDKTYNEERQRRFVITGLGGQGKSEICLRFADLMRDNFWGIFWVDVSSNSSASAGFQTISKQLGSLAHSIDETRMLISNLKQDWLLILDNADDPEFDYGIYFPSGTGGAIIMTSRNHECSIYSPIGSEEVSGLSENDCVSLLLNAAKIVRVSPEDEVAAKKIVNQLGSHTLALIQAGAYIALGYCTINKYPSIYQEQRRRLLEFSSKQAPSRYHNVYTTFEASIDILQSSEREDACDALNLLQVLSMLHYDNVPLQLFEDAWTGSQVAQKTNEENDLPIGVLSTWHVSLLPDFMQVTLDKWDPFRLQRAQNLLSSLALVNKTEKFNMPTLSMHPLTHAWVKDRQDLDQKKRSWKTTGSIFALSNYPDMTWKQYYPQFLPHVQPLLNGDVSKMDLLYPSMRVKQMFFQCGWILYHANDNSGLSTLLERMLRSLKTDVMVPTDSLWPLHYLVSLNYSALRKYKKAEHLLKHIFETQKGLSEDNLIRLVLEHELSKVYLKNGKTKQAIELLENIIQIQKMNLPKNNPNRLGSEHMLACAYYKNGQVKDAIQLFEHVVQIPKAVLPENHPHRFSIRELACLYLLTP
ncbi:MAG: hypothetical protein M1834_004334 [Cirrosporium novae-zelandiae]|nr:MAG: hypothetical protein M1834_004334 [Cirrosporium novae-zelandiae]